MSGGSLEEVVIEQLAEIANTIVPSVMAQPLKCITIA